MHHHHHPSLPSSIFYFHQTVLMTHATPPGGSSQEFNGNNLASLSFQLVASLHHYMSTPESPPSAHVSMPSEQAPPLDETPRQPMVNVPVLPF